MKKKPILYLTILITLLSCKPSAVKPKNTQKPASNSVSSYLIPNELNQREERNASSNTNIILSLKKDVLPSNLNTSLLPKNINITEQSIQSAIYYIPIPRQYRENTLDYLPKKLHFDTWTSNAAMSLPMFSIETGNNQIRTHRSSSLTDVSTGLIINFEDLKQPSMTIEYLNSNQNITGNLLRNVNSNTYVNFSSKWRISDLDINKTNELLNLPNPIQAQDQIFILVVQEFYFTDKSSNKTFRCYHPVNIESLDEIVYSVE